MKRTKHSGAQFSAGFSVMSMVISLVIILAIGGTGYYVWRNRQTEPNANTSGQTTSADVPNQQPSAPDSAQEGKYMIIKEWGVRTELPASLRGKVTYSLGEIMADPDGNQLQAAKVLVSNNGLHESACAISSTPIGNTIETGAQYIRSEKSKPFDASRYKFTFKENMLSSNGNNYHLNYVIPECLATSDIPTIQELQKSLEKLTLE